MSYRVTEMSISPPLCIGTLRCEHLSQRIAPSLLTILKSMLRLSGESGSRRAKSSLTRSLSSGWMIAYQLMAPDWNSSGS